MYRRIASSILHLYLLGICSPAGTDSFIFMHTIILMNSMPYIKGLSMTWYRMLYPQKICERSGRGFFCPQKVYERNGRGFSTKKGVWRESMVISLPRKVYTRSRRENSPQNVYKGSWGYTLPTKGDINRTIKTRKSQCPWTTVRKTIKDNTDNLK